MGEVLKRCWKSTNYKIVALVMIFSSLGIYLYNGINLLFILMDLPVIIIKIIIFDLIVGHNWKEYSRLSKSGRIILFLLINRIFQVTVVPMVVYLFF